MRILQVNSVCGVGSTGRIATDIHHELTANGHVSMIAFGRNEAKNCDNVYRIGLMKNILADVFMTRVFDRHGTMGKQATREFCAMIDAYQPDLVHLHNIHGYYLNIGMLMRYLKYKNIPVVWTLHDCWSFTGHCAYFDFPKCDRWKYACGSCPRLHDYPESWLLDHSRQNLASKKELFSDFKNLTIITPSLWLKDLVKQSFLGVYPVEVINNGIDLTKFRPVPSDLRSRYGLEGKRVYVSVAMVWDRRKGLDDLLALSNRLNDDEKLILIGLAKNQLAQLPANILGIQRTNSVDELAAFYAMADVTVVPSYEDNYPTVVLESLACHTPVIAYRTGGIPEMGDDPYVRLVPKGALDALLTLLRTTPSDLPWDQDFSRMDKQVSALAYVDQYQRIQGKVGE
ncbi:MAG: glycosyltransferase [Erysipelotrichaceae bacterium]